jgi:uncharacterized membrane protein HdeD (DUF308 family)
MLFVTLRSLIRNEPRVSPTARTTSVANQHQAHWYALASDAIPIVLGVYILLRTETILAKVKNRTPEQLSDRLNPIRFLFRAIGSLAIVAGLIFLFRHLFSF